MKMQTCQFEEVLTSGGCLFFSVITSTRLLPTMCVALSTELVSTDGTEEANRAFGGPVGRDGLIAHVKTFRILALCAES